MRFIDTTPDSRNNFIDNAEKVLLGLEADRQGLKHTLSLHINAFVTVDQDIVDGRILEQRLERTEARHFVENFRDEIVEFLGIQRKTFNQHVLRNQLLNVTAEFFLRHLVQSRKIDVLDQPAVQAHLCVEQFVAEQRPFWRCGTPDCETTDHISRPPLKASVSSTAAWPDRRPLFWMRPDQAPVS